MDEVGVEDQLFQGVLRAREGALFALELFFLGWVELCDVLDNCGHICRCYGAERARQVFGTLAQFIVESGNLINRMIPFELPASC